ncbi:hypothetical protein MUN84_01155 [Hymenobacter sp. 5516J-16]|uniref:hypothetical protein n=1 Tax=Hymenobacter sp. 5516J-16 TaxID=2932253 RepID=UPI001FD49D5D|nr:hypothetical protein [Hymenobacter sp. 5516J-16]UOQ77359.1 hypothetical protein MUN84_01155 [Hymenobacter sp. 5516J-16]
MLPRLLLLAFLCLGASLGCRADDGYRLWLKYDELPEASLRKAWQDRARGLWWKATQLLPCKPPPTSCNSGCKACWGARCR